MEKRIQEFKKKYGKYTHPGHPEGEIAKYNALESRKKAGHPEGKIAKHNALESRKKAAHLGRALRGSDTSVLGGTRN